MLLLLPWLFLVGCSSDSLGDGVGDDDVGDDDAGDDDDWWIDGTPILSFWPDPIDDQATVGGLLCRDVAIRNPGTGTLAVDSLAITEDAGGRLSFTIRLPDLLGTGIVPPDGERYMGDAFCYDCAEAGTLEGIIRIESNDPESPVTEIDVTVVCEEEGEEAR